jgi:hypothetical protein
MAPAIHVRCSESVGSPANLGSLTAAVRAGPIVFGDLKTAAGAKIVPIRGVGYAWKAFAIVLAGRGPAALRALDPPGTIGLDYGSLTNRRVATGSYTLAQSTRTAVFPRCPSQTGYVGGFILRRPMCVNLQVIADGRVARLRLPIGVRACN